MSCKPKEFHGSEGAVGLMKWIEGMETVLHISKCREADKVEFASCQLQDRAQTWWKTQMQIRGREAAYQLTWEEFTNLLTEEYCSKDEKQKLENEFWNHSMEGSNIDSYNVRFQELARLVPHMVTPEEKRIDRYIWGLAPEIRGMVTSANPTTMQSAVVLANRLTSDLIRSGVFSKDNIGNKREADLQSVKEAGGNSNKKRKRVRNFGAITPGTKQQGMGRYKGSHPKCDKCSRHHEGDCFHCSKCGRFGHTDEYCRPDKLIQKACFECGNPNHVIKNCPNINQRQGNNAQNQKNRGKLGNKARGRAFVIEAEEE